MEWWTDVPRLAPLFLNTILLFLSLLTVSLEHLLDNCNASVQIWLTKNGFKHFFFPFELRANAAWNLSPRPRGQKVTWAEAVTSTCCTLTWRHGGKEEVSEGRWTLLCRRSAQQSKLYEHQLHARHLDAPIYRGSRCEREMVEICAAPPSRFSKSRFQSMPHCVPSISGEVVTKTAWHLLWRVWRTRSGIKSSSRALFPQYMQLCQKFRKN